MPASTAWDLNVQSDATHGIYGHVIIDKFLVTGNIKKMDGDFKRDKSDGGGLGTMIQKPLYGASENIYKGEGFLSTVMERQLAPLKRRQSSFYVATAPKGLSAGLPSDCMPACFGDYGKTWDNSSECGIKFDLAAQSKFDEGTIYIGPDVLLAGGTSGVSIEDDNGLYSGGATNFGGAMYVWLPQVNGGTNATYTFTLTHATATGGSYTAVTGAVTPAMKAGEIACVEIPSYITINAATQISWAAAGSPTGAEAFAVFARRYNPAK